MKTGDQECGEKLQVAEISVHHNILNSKTLTHQLRGGRGGDKRFGKEGEQRQTGLEGLRRDDSGGQNSLASQKPRLPNTYN